MARGTYYGGSTIVSRWRDRCWSLREVGERIPYKIAAAPIPGEWERDMERVRALARDDVQANVGKKHRRNRKRSRDHTRARLH